MGFIFLVASQERLTFIASAHFIALQGLKLQFRNTIKPYSSRNEIVGTANRSIEAIPSV
jgi:hypothetical protein